MKVHLSFDVEVWCNGWNNLDAVFPAAFDRYIYGRSDHGSFALPKTLEILQRYGLTAVFFVEPLFAARFGQRYLAEVVQMILAAGQDVQLHLHPEWTDEIKPPPIADVTRKRQHLNYYTLDEQIALIALGKCYLEAVTGRSVQAFRAGSYAANADTFTALRHLDIKVDSSLNEIAGIGGEGLNRDRVVVDPQMIDGVCSFPVTVFQDGIGRLRPAQVGACSFSEMREAMIDAERKGHDHFVAVSHNFEMLKPGSNERDIIVVNRFEKLCALLANRHDIFHVTTYPVQMQYSENNIARPKTTVGATGVRYLEQALRRIL